MMCALIDSLNAWREKYALESDAFAGAYAALDGKERAALKTCIARLHRIFGELPAAEGRTRRFDGAFCLREEQSPAEFVVLACPSSGVPPAALLAALMPAVLAGARHILPCFIARRPAADELPAGNGAAAHSLAALELAGVEEAFLLSEEGLDDLLQLLRPRAAFGRLLLLGRPPFCEPQALSALRAGLVCRFLPLPARYYSSRLSRAAELGERDFAGAECPDGEDDGGAMLLSLDAAHEDVWIWPDLGPERFRVTRLKLASL